MARLDRPLHAWSLIVTVFGDAVVPRGGSLWLGTLNDIMGAFGIGAGVVRTAMSRLAADGWVTRDRTGRNSYYRLTPKATALSEAAAVRIYRLPQRGWSGTWSLVVPKETPGTRLAERRAALHRAGFAQLGAGLFIAPAGHNMPDKAERVFAFSARSGRAKSSDLDQDREVFATSAWKLDR
ncbi:MAG: GntR family transcriptional regulator, partial [Sphingomonadales bacterium]|nr:GntR family transcriptional regulator [Sphingomonadales bacterium]